MEQRHTFPEIMLQISIAAIACMLFNLPLKPEEGIPVTLYILFFAFALISYVLSRLFFRRPKSLAAAVLFHAVLILAGFAAAFVLGLLTGALAGIFLGLFFLILSVMAFRETVKGIHMNTLTLCFDSLAVLLLIHLLFLELGDGRFLSVLPGVIGIIAALAGSMSLREGSRISGRERLFSILLIAGIVVVAFLVYLVAGDPLRKGFTGIFAGLGAALSWLGQLIKKILLFFSSLFPQEQYEAVDLDMDGGIRMPAGEGGEEAVFSPVPLLILGGIVLIAAGVAAFVLFRKHRFSGETVAAAAKKTREKKERISLWNALRIWAKEKQYRLKVYFYFLKNRNTPAGRFYRLVRSKKRTALSLRQGETPGEYLTRYIGSLQSGDKRIPELAALIGELNMQLYNR